MYEDVDLWPIKCPYCFHEFTEQLGRLNGLVVRCPDCSTNVRLPDEQLRLMVSEAKAGRYDPWRDLVRLKKPD